MPSNKLRILSTGMGWPSSQAGGLNTYFKNICENLSVRHTHQALVCSKEKPMVKQGLLVTNIADPDMKLGKRRNLFRTHAAKLMDEQEFDIVYSHFAPYGVGVAEEARRRNIPVIMAFHGPWSEEIRVEGRGITQRIKAWIAKSMEMKAYRLADAFIVLSETFRDVLHHQYGIPLERIFIIAGAADIRRFQPTINQMVVRRSLGLDEDCTMVLTVRRLVNRMGLLQLLDAWREVVLQAPGAVLLIGGKGPLKEQLERRITEYGLEGKVRLLGYISDSELPLYYQAADMFVVPTQSLEGFGLITVEAMASGLPVAATPVGGSREILERFHPEMLFRSERSSDIAAGLIHLLKHKQQWPTSEQCRNHILENYTWEQVASQVEALFEGVIDKHRSLDGHTRNRWSTSVVKGRHDTDVKSGVH
ncbi:glycosyltransferase family 4 protein [Paenibacillus agricola]|uniref:Glycosyltransferase family 4 protein n=1 Tax=Paenibacillus agricola TaxID=2716264 RepID=A0ABX0J278_9BACL|nr:glycosyltransferase family 4 protein [Paenibacillus agricola]NHN29931.1 glycosyltransferase family 4 protein [Paenibacillus agricola]